MAQNIPALTERQKTIIVNNVVKAIKHGIDNLNQTGYNYLYLCSGFIAHNNLNGFIAHYQDRSLRHDILNNERANMWNNFRPGDQHYDYYMSKAAVYKRIIQKIK